MDVFRVHRELIQDYAAFTRSFSPIRDARIQAEVDAALDRGALWPAPWIQLNPTFELAGSTNDLVAEGLLHPRCKEIFRVKKHAEDPGKPFTFYRHQVQAIETALRGGSYILTTGTGSGKSIAYIVPIVDRILRDGTGKGIRAIVVYPMNALANSQAGELEKFVKFGFEHGKAPLTFERYTGQESEEDRERIVTNPPDILLTNYVMLELILTRSRERKQLIKAARGKLQFLVLDELHTYRGRQGSDVAFLVRRTREACDAPHLQCVGTSATLAGSGNEVEAKQEVARVATKLFGTPVPPENVIGETLTRATEEMDFTAKSMRDNLTARVQGTTPLPATADAFVQDPLAAWMESAFGLTKSQETGRLIRQKPKAIHGPRGVAQDLAVLTGVDEVQAGNAIAQTLLQGSEVTQEREGVPMPFFAFRIHQFLGNGDTVYASLEPESTRHVTVEAQVYKPEDRSTVLLPLAFCRECGEEYYVVQRTPDARFLPRDLGDQNAALEQDHHAGFLHVDSENPWPTSDAEVRDRLPEDWLEYPDGQPLLNPKRRDLVPRVLYTLPDGRVDPSEQGLKATWIPSPFRFCLHCGISYSWNIRSDYTKLSRLSAGGRSTATTVLSLKTIEEMRKAEDLEPEARKLLSFTDNRQDASLQAGHFNDFVEITLIRGALHKAIEQAGPNGLANEKVIQAVFENLALPIEEYAANPQVEFMARVKTDDALRAVLAYRIFQDLQRGWRVTMPNLEQSGLLDIDYLSLNDIAATDRLWQGKHAALASASPETRAEICRVLLDDLRRHLAIKSDPLSPTKRQELKDLSGQYLNERWGLSDNENLVVGAIVYPRSKPRQQWGTQDFDQYFLSGHGSFGRWLRRPNRFPNLRGRLDTKEGLDVIQDLLQVLANVGMLEIFHPAKGEGQVPGYQLVAGNFVWKSGDGTKAAYDPTRLTLADDAGGRVNAYFVHLYKERALGLRRLEAREHTAQVWGDVRREREDRFRRGDLPILYCSPTMELGVDIAQLNAVHLRNVPPTPANYAQRSGRAGRQGQPAIVTSYCASGSPHDQYFFRRSQQMVAGAVTPPRLDLSNEELVRAHVHSVWLACADLWLGGSMKQVLDLTQDDLPINENIRYKLDDPKIKKDALAEARRLLATVEEDMKQASWYSATWVGEAIHHVPTQLDEACSRWRTLYRSARKQRDEQDKVASSPTAEPKAKDRARRLRKEAENQLDLLTSESTDRNQSDFYPYRYLASEGFLPGYSFPRLPLSAYIPAGRGRDEYLSRPRFLAISEYGPGAFVYHEGARYQVTKVIIPPELMTVEEDLPLELSVKQCAACGYLHPCLKNTGPDVCDSCGVELGNPIPNLFRMQNVEARRRERITSDEEERQRMGYEMRTGVRFSLAAGKPARWGGTVLSSDGEIARLTYGDAATIWRINLGWRRRTENAQLGYWLDLVTGRWLSDREMGVEAKDELPSLEKERRVARVVPYVEDTKNCVLLNLGAVTPEVLMSTAYALKQGIQTAFQLEDSELALEFLPDDKAPREAMFFEAAEGGAGVLKRLLLEPESLALAAREALAICHFDPDTGEDRGHAEGAQEICEAACYDCLLSYRNQRQQAFLDRKAAHAHLMELVKARVEAGPQAESRREHYNRLLTERDSQLEKKWLDMVYERQGRLPTDAQYRIAKLSTTPDFYYKDDGVAIYVDGPPHDDPQQKTYDTEITRKLTDAGYTVLRFHHADEARWLEVLRSYPSVFGPLK